MIEKKIRHLNEDYEKIAGLVIRRSLMFFIRDVYYIGFWDTCCGLYLSFGCFVKCGSRATI